MPADCPRCRTANPDTARYCGRCGLPLEGACGGVPVAGRVPHPQPLPLPYGFEPVGSAVNLFFQWEAVSGGAPLSGTEPLAVSVFNAGYDLARVVLRIRGADDSDRTVCVVLREIAGWPRGTVVRFEIPSYELPAPVRNVAVELVQAEFGSGG